MQSWAVRSCGFFGRRPPREVRRRADDGHAQVRADAHGDHVLRHLLAEANAGVVALGDDVGQAIVDDELHLDVGIVRQQRRERRPEDRLGRVLARRDADGAGGFSRSSLSAASSAPILSSAGPSVRSSRSPASVGATLRVVRVSSRTPSRVLQPADGEAQRRLGGAELRRGPREAALLGDRDEGVEIGQLLASAFMNSEYKSMHFLAPNR